MPVCVVTIVFKLRFYKQYVIPVNEIFFHTVVLLLPLVNQTSSITATFRVN